MNDTSLTSYDRVAYPSVSHVDMHPATIAAVAALCGHAGTPRRGYRVLELGCGSGANLMSMALAAPESDFVGTDLAPTAVEIASAVAKTAGLTNVRFEARDILAPGTPEGPFDYIIAHGVYAWGPPAGRARILPLGAELLAPEGVAAISYNVRPGCHIRQVIRDQLLHATRGIADPGEKLKRARDFLKYQIEGWNVGDPYCAALRLEAEAALKRDPGVLYHDELGDWFDPQMLSEVVAAARAAGLDYLCDSHISFMGEALFPGRATEAARRWTGGDWVGFEQMLDFTGMRRFRRSVFTRAGKVGDRAFHPSRLAGLCADAELAAETPDAQKPGIATFRGPRDEEVDVSSPDIAALLRSLGENFPNAIDLTAYSTREALPQDLLEVLVSGVVTPRTRPLNCTAAPGARPLASSLARAQAARGETRVAAIKGGAARLADDGIKAFLMLLDGTRTHEDISEAMARKMGVSVAEAASRTPVALAHLAKLGVMVA